MSNISYSGHLASFFAKPQKWTSLHRDLLHVREDQVSAESLIGSTYLPQYGDQGMEYTPTRIIHFGLSNVDPEFEAIAAEITKPTI